MMRFLMRVRVCIQFYNMGDLADQTYSAGRYEIAHLGTRFPIDVTR